MGTKTGRHAALILVTLALLSTLIAAPVRGNPPLQGAATEQAASTAEAGSVDDLSVISSTPLDLLAGPLNTMALNSPDGLHFAYVTMNDICLYTAAGQQEGTCADISKMRIARDSLRWSPDGSRLVMVDDFLRRFLDPDVWVVDMATGKITDVTDDGVIGTTVLKEANANIDLGPIWSADSKSVMFIRYIQTGKEYSAPTLFTVPAEGGTAERLVELPSPPVNFAIYTLAMSPDGTKIAYNVDAKKPGDPLSGVWLADSDAKNPKPLLKALFGQFPSVIEFSADGRYVLVSSNVGPATRPEQSPVRIAPVDGSGDFLVDTGNLVRAAAWAPSGHGLAYVVYDDVHPETSGLYLTADPGKPGRLVLPGRFAAPNPTADRLSWSADNTILLATPGGKPLYVVHLGHK